MTAKELLESAAATVSGQRQVDHGDAVRSMQIVAALWQVADDYRDHDKDLAAWEVALRLKLFKDARIMVNPTLIDNWRDDAGYAGIGCEAALYEAALNEKIMNSLKTVSTEPTL